jgi:hypothetical protein
MTKKQTTATSTTVSLARHHSISHRILASITSATLPSLKATVITPTFFDHHVVLLADLAMYPTQS